MIHLLCNYSCARFESMACCVSLQYLAIISHFSHHHRHHHRRCRLCCCCSVITISEFSELHVRKTDCCHVNILTVNKFCLLFHRVCPMQDVLYCAVTLHCPQQTVTVCLSVCLSHSHFEIVLKIFVENVISIIVMSTK